MLSNANKFWTWLVVSSSNPEEVALTVKGWMSAIVPVLLFVIHNPNLNSLPDGVYAVVIALLAIVSAVVTAYGIIIKIIRTFNGTNAAMQAFNK